MTTAQGVPPLRTRAGRPVRLAYVVTHPIQYQAPLLRRVAARPDIDLTVFFQSDLSVRGCVDPGFGRPVTWDVPLLEGYRHEFLPALGGTDRVDVLRPWSYGLWRRLLRGRFDVLWVHGYGRPYNIGAIAAARVLGLKVLLRDEATSLSRARSPARQAAKRLFFALLSRAVTAFLAIGSLNRDYYREHGIAADRIFPVPYAVDNEFFRQRVAAARPDREVLRARLGLPPDRPVILFASKFEPRKRARDLLEAVRRLPALLPPDRLPVLLYIGDGEERAALEHGAAGLPHVHFLGFRNQSELPAFFDLCDVFVLPSVDEPWGLVVNEAMNAGRAIVVSDRVGCGPDLVRDGENGRVFPAGDPDALARALAGILHDPARMAAMGAAGLRIIEDWGFEQDLRGLLAALEYALGRR
ncbi:glycosyltransferase family 4 protein [Rhodospirillum centenum]|uniref:glycosyltransferase family 4 protein n=1 Tax=Rhodospirillum centenum TaxID=34018 RepID=UPI0006742EF3|nr:glycosyltransferase family 4 protein [Rhodospirillum centenum]